MKEAQNQASELHSEVTGMRSSVLDMNFYDENVELFALSRSLSLLNSRVNLSYSETSYFGMGDN